MDESTAAGRATPEPDTTGDPAVDSVLSRLRDVAETPVGEHAALYAGLHNGLLEALNEEPAQPQPSRPGPGSA
ncbi:MAG: hypothetical protein ABTA24_11120 [Arthrobacter sp.]